MDVNHELDNYYWVQEIWIQEIWKFGNHYWVQEVR